MKLSPIDAANKFIQTQFPSCNIAILAGSVSQGYATERSDLDLVIIDDAQPSFRASYFELEWPIEVFTMKKNVYKDFFKEAQKEAIPTLMRMCRDGIVLKDDGTAQRLIHTAVQILHDGPIPWNLDDLNQNRYDISELLEDLVGSTDRAEQLFIVNKLIFLTNRFILRVNDQWFGDGKWSIRMVKEFDSHLYTTFIQVIEQFYTHHDKEPLIQFVDQQLEPFGGRFFAGFVQEPNLP